jgi:hypothetical protein
MHVTVEEKKLSGGETMAETDQGVPLGEACPDCRALVADLEEHSRWHSRLVADIANAVENEIKRTSSATG